MGGTIALKDQDGHSLFDVALGDEQGLGRYLQSPASLRSVRKIAELLKTPVDEAGDSGRQLVFALEQDVGLGPGRTLSVTANAQATFSLHTGETALFAGDDLLAPVPVPGGTAYASLELAAQIAAGLGGKRDALAFGFTGGTSLRYAFYRPFDTAGARPSVGEALETVLVRAAVPATVADLVSLDPGAIVSVRGDGELSIEATAALSAAANPLATPSLPIVGGLSLGGAASLLLGASYSYRGGHELRVSKLDARRVQLAFHRRAGQELSVSAKATAGVDATFGPRDLIAALVSTISPNAEADLLAFVNAGLTDEQIAAIEAVIAASLDRSLQIAAQLALSDGSEDVALFAYELTLDALGAAGEAAVAEALGGRLTAIERLADAGAPGVRALASGSERLLRRAVSWKLNVFGVVNFASLRELLRHAVYSFDGVSGTLNIADTITARRIGVLTAPLADSTRLRRVVFESMVAAAAYQTSRVLPATVSLTLSHQFVEQHGRTGRSDMESHFRALVTLGLCEPTEAAARLANLARFGASTFLLEAVFDKAACEALFLDDQGKPFGQEHYERIGRHSLLALLPSTDPDLAFRRPALEQEALWGALRTLPDFATTLPGTLASRAPIIRTDVLTVLFWATAMSRAAAALAKVRQIVGGGNVPTAAGNPVFDKARQDLERALADMASNTDAQFDEPWDVVALDTAAARLGRLHAIIVSPTLSVAYGERSVVPDPAIQAASAARTRAMFAARALGRAVPSREWTPQQRDLLERHVVNIRRGRLSGDGTFSSTDRQVRRVFETLIPEAIAALSATGEPLRVVFYAHGGLIDEIGGLTPVLARRRFWLSNGIYPVFFVWETGLLDSLRDELGALTGGPRATAGARSPLTDAVLERVARPGGKLVWDRMKENAALASAAGGAARTVAQLARTLNAEHAGRVEFHAVGHSAGAIFHAYFLPVLTAGRADRVTIRSLHLLAPAITTVLFKQSLKSIIGVGKAVASVTMYTMADDLEQADSTVHPYGKSLLYLVSRGFEAGQPTPILGMQESLNRDVELIRFFGLAGREQVGEVLFSRTLPQSPRRSRTESTTHGGFDEDVATMGSVVRRVIGATEQREIVDFIQDPVVGPGEAVAPATGSAVPARGLRLAARGTPAVRVAGRKPWTVLVWMAGDNHLERFGERDLAEMKRVGSSDALDVVVQFDRMRDDRTRRYHVKTGGSVASDIVQELGETHTGDPAVATDFFTWGVKQYPSERVLAIIWNHGSGIDEEDIHARSAARGIEVVRGARTTRSTVPRSVVRTALSHRHRRAVFGTTVDQAIRTRAIAYDDTAKDFLDNVELKRVLSRVKKRTGRTIDIMGFDACLMNMIEVAYQVRTAAGLIVGSEEIEPGDGWPYDKVLGAIAGNPAISARDLGQIMVDRYVASFRSFNVTQSLLDVARVGQAADAVDTLAAALIRAIKTSSEQLAVLKALSATQSFDMPQFVDLVDFCRQLRARSRSAGVKAATKTVEQAVTGEGGLVAHAARKGRSVGGAEGVAIFFPRQLTRGGASTYRRLDFAKATRWGSFLAAYHRP